MAYRLLTFTCAAAANTFYVPVPYDCTLLSARFTSSGDPGSNKTVVLSKSGGNTIISGNLSATPGTIVEGTMTATVADERQALTPTAPLKLVITTSNAVEVGICLDLDEFKRNPIK